MEFGALGPLRVLADGQAVAIGAGRQRAVLAILMLRANRMVSIPHLIDGVWGECPPDSARRLVHTYVWRLRRLLGQRADGGPLAGGPAGYVLQVRPGELDITEFERLFALGRAAIARGDPADGAGLLRTALTLWRGEPLEDVALYGDYGIDLARLTGQRISAQEERIAADLACGCHETVIADIEQLLVAHPLRESLIAQLMLALHRAGRRAEALQVFWQARTRLVDELGLDPGSGLQRLHRQILADDPALSAAPPSADVRRDVPRQLPAAVWPFVGRAAEIGILAGLLNQAAPPAGTVAISAIEGTAGIGKSALAVQFAHQAASRFPDGQLYINLHGFDPATPPLRPDAALRVFLEALAVPDDRIPSTLDGLIGAYRTMLTGKQMLVVLDNARDAAQARPLIPGSPSCLVIITSRSQLAGLAATEAAQVLRLDLLTGQEARELLARRLGAGRVTSEPHAASELITLCARLPLALSIAAARAAAQPDLALAALAAELRDARTRLDALDTGDLAANTRAAFSWSYQNLDQTTARMFRLLGVHPGPDIGVSAAASLAGLPRQDAGWALAELTRANLVANLAPGRYAFHDLLRVYAAERASADDSPTERHAAVRRMLDHYLHSAQAAVIQRFPTLQPVASGAPPANVIPDDMCGHDAALAWFAQEHHVLLAVISQAFTEGFDTHAWQIPWAISPFLNLRCAWQDWLDIQHIALAAARRCGDRTGLAHAYDSLGYAQARAGRFEAAQPLLHRALDLFSQLGDRVNQASVHNSLTMMHERRGDAGAALHHARQALRLCRAAGYRVGQARALNSMGWYHSLLGENRRALTCCQEALALFQDLRDRFGQVAAWDSLGHAHHHLGDHHRAIACYQQALDLIGGLGDRYNEAGVLRHLAESRQATGDLGGARRAWTQALEILDDLHHPDAEPVRDQLRDLDEAVSRRS